MRRNIMKILFVFTILLLSISMSSCGDDNSDSAQDSSPTSSTDSSDAMETLVDWMKAGVFSYDFELIMEYQGETTESEGTMAMDDGDYAMVMDTEVEGTAVTSKIIIKDDKMYMIDDANKMIMTMSTLSSDLTGGMPTEYSDMEKSGSGEGKVDGKTLPYDEYTIEGYSIKYYMDGDMVYAMESEVEDAKSTIIIKNAKKTAPKDMFILPEGYQEVKLN